MTVHGLSRTAAVAVAMIGLGVSAAQAQVARSGGGASAGQSAELVKQLQQLASERTALTAENAKLKKDLEDARKERDGLKGAQQALERQLKASTATVKALQDGAAARRNAADQELARTKDNLQQLIARFRDTVQTMRQIETDRAAAKQTIAARDQSLNLCIDRNLALYRMNQEVLGRLEHQGVWGRLARAEPFTQIKRIELENLVDEYKSRAEDQRFPGDQAGVGPGAATAPPAAAPGPASTPNR